MCITGSLWEVKGFPGGASGKESTYQCRRLKRCRLDPWVGNIPWRRKWLPTLIFLVFCVKIKKLLWGASFVAHLVKNPPAMRETWVYP